MAIVKINGKEVDLVSPYDVATNFINSDLETLSLSKSYSSDTFKLAGTNNNKNILGHPNDWNSLSHQSQKNKPTLVIESKEGVVEFTGYAKIIASVIDEQVVGYTVKAIGNNGDWISKLKNRYLSELDLSKYNHDYTLQSINISRDNSWFQSIYGESPNFFVYDLIDRGYNLPQPKQDDSFMPTTYPAISIYHLVHKCFNLIGYRLTSDFVESDFFKKLYMPYVGKLFKVNDQWKQDKYFKGVNDYVQSVALSAGVDNSLQVAFNNVSTNEGSNPSNLYKNVTSGTFKEFISPTTGKLRFKFGLSWSIAGGAAGTVIIHLCKRRAWDGYSDYKSSSIWSKDFSIGAAGATHNYHEEIPAQEIFCGDRVWIELEFNPLSSAGNGMFTLWTHVPALPQNCYFSLISYDSELPVLYGHPVDLSYNLPHKLIVDFIKGVFQNCEIKTDVDSRTIYIEPFDVFYNGATEDWSELLDTSKNVEINFIGDKLSKTVRYRYKEDSNDYKISSAEKANNIPYGCRDVEVQNNFAKAGTQEIKNNFFAPTYEDVADSRNGYNGFKGGLAGIVIPKMFKEQIAGTHNTDFEPRILIYDGMVNLPSGTFWKEAFLPSNQIGSWHMFINRASYPRFYFAGQKEGDYNLSYEDTATNYGLFNTQLRQKHKIIDDSRLFKMNIRLTSALISNLDFRKPKAIKYNGETSFFLLKEISGFNSSSNESTYCELIKIVGQQPLSSLGVIHKSLRTALQPDNGLIQANVVGGVTNINVGNQMVITISQNGTVNLGGENVYELINNVWQEVVDITTENKIANVKI